jgi:hypothetical protein
LLTKREIFQDESLTGTQGAENPADEVPKRTEHGRDLIGRLATTTACQSFLFADARSFDEAQQSPGVQRKKLLTQGQIRIWVETRLAGRVLERD